MVVLELTNADAKSVESQSIWFERQQRNTNAKF
jgi:hypothetical protein